MHFITIAQLLAVHEVTCLNPRHSCPVILDAIKAIGVSSAYAVIVC